MDSPPRKRKIVTYGKQSTRTYGGFGDHFGDPFDDEPPPKRRSTSPHRLSTPRKPTSSSKTPLQKLDSGIDDWEVPSSDDEPASIPIPEPPRGKLAKVLKQPAPRSRPKAQAQQTQAKKTTACPRPNKRLKTGAAEVAKARNSDTANVEAQSDPECTTKPAAKTSKAAVSTISSRSRGNQPVTPRKKATGKNARTAARGLSTPPSEASGPTPRQTPSRSSRPSPSHNNRSVEARPVTPSTPTSSSSSKQSTPASFRRPVTTPRQSRMWSDLLQASDNEATPSGRLNKLSLDYDTAELPQPLSTTDTPRKRRLVDALKEAQVPSSDGLESEDGSVLDVEMEDAAADPQEPVDVAMSQQPTQAPLPAPSTGHKHTYGGSRSYLQEQAQSFEELLSQPLEDLDSPVPAQPKTSLTMRKGGGSAADEFDVSDDDTAGKGLRSIHELRAAGGRSAFQRDMEALGDELRSDNITRKRNAALDLSKKLIDGPFRGRFIQAGYGPDMLRALGSTKDPLIPVSQAVLATTLLDDNAAFVNLNACLDTTIIDSLILALAEPRDLVAIAKDRKTNMSRLAQSSVADLKAKLLNFEPLQLNGQRQVPPQSVALRALEMIVRKLRESGNLRDPFLRPAMLGKITSIMDSAIANTMTASHTELEPSDLGTALSILESCSLSPLCVADEATWTPILLTQVVESLQIVLGSDHQQSLQLLALRFTINMTNSSGRNADFFAHSQLLLALLNKVQAGLDALPSETSSSSQLDLLLLTLGCLINLVECSGAVRRTLSQDHRSQLEELIKRFVGNRKKAADADSLEATQVNIAYGYLAIFFGHCSQSAALRLLITDELPTKRLDMIIEAVEEFVKHNQETDKRAGSEAYASFTERLRSVVETLRNPDD